MIFKVRNIAIFTALSLVLAACATSKSYQDAGVYQGTNYEFDVTWEDKGLFRETYISINGDRVLTIDRDALKAAPCQKTSAFVEQCAYKTEYAGKTVDIVQNVDVKMYQQNAYYKISFNGTLIRTITIPLL